MEETLEEAAERLYPDRLTFMEQYRKIEQMSFIAGANYQAERMYSEEEVLDILFKHTEYFAGFGVRLSLTDWFEQFKKK
jgi:hypothetical protein